MVGWKLSNPSWQQMAVSAGPTAPSTDYLGLPVRDVDAEESRYSYIEQHRVSLCAVVALLALTSVCLFFVAFVGGPSAAAALSSMAPSTLYDVRLLPTSLSNFLRGQLPSDLHLLPPTAHSSAADKSQVAVDQLTGEVGEVTQSQSPAASQPGSAIAATLHSAPNIFYVVPFVSLLSASSSPAVSSSSVFGDVSSALSAARTFRSSGSVASAVYIYLYPTVHFQSAPVRLTVADSGVGASQPLVLASMPVEAVTYFRGLKLQALKGADAATPAVDAASSVAVRALHSEDKPRAVLSGGRRLTGWSTTDRPAVYQLKVEDTLTINQLFVSDRRATRSRLPPKPTDFYRVQNTAGGQKTSMTVEPGVLAGISNLAQVEFVVYHSWTASRHYYKSHQPQSGYVETDNPTMWDFGFRQGDYLRYSVENAAEGMDRPGTWYFDTAAHTVYFWSDTHPDTLEVVVPVMDTVLAVEGERDEAKRVAWVEVRDVDIAHSSWHIDRGQSADYQATAWIGYAAVHVQYASNVLFSNVHIHHTGSYAWWCEKGCTDVTLRDSQLSDTASGGVRIGMDRLMQAGNVPAPPDVLRRVYVLHNSIHNTGLVFPDGVGVLQQRVEECVVSGNHIHHTYYSGISAGWEWGYADSGSRNNTISSNYIHDIGRGLLTDQAGIYTLGSANTSVIRDNVIHNVHSWAGLDWGIYLDEGSVGWTVTHNIMYNTGWASFFLHYGKDNTLTNNVFARAGPLRGDYAVDWVEKHLSLTGERNIVYDTYQPPVEQHNPPHVTFEAGNDVRVKLDYNTYWSQHALDQRFGGAKQTLAEWQKSGQDQHSVYADPLFLHADQCDFFELDPSSPAIKLGFQPIQRLEQWKPGCDDPTLDDEDSGTAAAAAIVVPAGQDTTVQEGKAMNQDKLAAEFMKRDREEKERQERDKQDADKQTTQAAEQKGDQSKNDAAVVAEVQPVSDTAPSHDKGAFYVVPFVSLLSASSSPAVSSSSVFGDVSSALSAARTFRSSGSVASAVYIYLYPTVHFQSAPVRLTVADSGVGASQPLVLASMPVEAVTYFRGLKLQALKGADAATPAVDAASSVAVRALHSEDKPRAVLSGGRRLTGWSTTDRPAVYQLKVEDTLTINQLFVSDRRATRSRLPPKPTDFYRVQNTAGGQKTSMTVEPGVLAGISNLAQVEFVVYHSWTASRHYYKSHQPQSGYVETDNPTMWDFGFRQGDYLRYSVENAAEGMDRPGTWYFDTAAHTVYFWSDTHPDTLEVVVPVMDTVLAVEGERDEAKRVAWVEVRDVDIAHSSWHIDRGQSADYQATAWIGYAAVHVQYASNVLFSNVHIHHTGSYAWWCEKGCTDVTLRDSQLSDTASGGVRIGMDRLMQAGNVPAPPDVLRRVYVLHNSIHNTGLVFPDGVGVLQQRVEECVVSGNHIHHTYYSGISAGWEWGYADSGSRNNTISSNYIHDIGRGLLTDQAGIYTLGSANTSVIRDNVIHNVHSWAGLDWGIYLDEGSVGWTVTHNIMYNTGWASFFLHYGKDNTLTNNVFARAGPLRGDYAVDWVEKHLSLTGERNIVYDTYQPPVEQHNPPHVTFEAGNDVRVKLDYNTYWSQHALDQRFGGAKQTLAEWQKSGQDQHSVYADPLFLHADQCDFFELDPSSPAIKLGFQPIQRLEQWKPGCDDPTLDDEDSGTAAAAAIVVPAGQDTTVQEGKAMNQDKLAAEFMKRDREEKERQERDKQDADKQTTQRK